MSILRPISIFLRNALVKQHPYFSCCASCGEIKTPLANRLCASLAVPFTVDTVILSADSAAAAACVRAFDKHCPWVRRIFIVARDAASLSGITRTERVRPIPAGEFMPPDSPFGPEAYCHAIPGISDYFLIAPPDCRAEHDCLPIDFFTPNGIPLLRLRKSESGDGIIGEYVLAPGIFPQTKENAVAFLLAAGDTPPPGTPGYYAEAARQAFTAGAAVPAKG